MDVYTCYYKDATDDGRVQRVEKCDYQTIELKEAMQHVADNPEHEVRDIHGRVVVAGG